MRRSQPHASGALFLLTLTFIGSCSVRELERRPSVQLALPLWDDSTLTEREFDGGLFSWSFSETEVELERDAVHLNLGFGFWDEAGLKMHAYGSSIEFLRLADLDVLQLGVYWQSYATPFTLVRPYARGEGFISFFGEGQGAQLGIGGALGAEIPFGDHLFADLRLSHLVAIESFETTLINLDDDAPDYRGSTLYLGMGWDF